MAEKLFSKDHVWVQTEGVRSARIGITRFAREELGEIVYIELPASGKSVQRDQGICAFDSLKSSSEVYAPVSGKILTVNDALSSDLSPINTDPEGEGWLFMIELADPAELSSLMDASRYAEFTGT